MISGVGIGSGAATVALEMMDANDETRGRQIAVGGAIILTLGFLAVTGITGWRYLPGLAGEVVGFVVGILTTPFFLETTAAIVGLITVIVLNSLRRRWAGDEYVAIEELEAREAGRKPQR